MRPRQFLLLLFVIPALMCLCTGVCRSATERPNIVFILADDLGYGELGCYGQQRIKTPEIDQLAAQGIRFTDCYAGSTVCAPSRCTLMTGYHTGHARIRGNALMSLQAQDVTVAQVLKQSGYATAIIGKWGLGEAGTAGVPNKKGFDYWFGYLNQNHAHNYYPDFLWRNGDKVPLPNVVPAVAGREFGSGVATKRVVYSHDLFAKEALDFVARQAQARSPFFLYLAFTIPHANNEAKPNGMEVPDLGPYGHETWPAPEKGKAAMITRMDADVGRLMAKLRELGIDEKTIVFFTSDNGPHKEGGVDPQFFRSGGPLQGIKRSLHEGGIREPMLVRWPGKIAPGRTSDLPWAFWDVLPTLAELAGAKVPAGLDGISVVPTLMDRGVQQRHEFMYWEFHEGPSQQAVRMDNWKAIRKRPGAALELYDLRRDPAERTNVAAEHPEIVQRIERYLKTARSESKTWPIRDAAPHGESGRRSPLPRGTK